MPQHERGGDGHGSSSSCSPELTNAHAWVSGVSQAKGKAPQNWFVPPMRQENIFSGISEGMGPVSWLSARTLREGRHRGRKEWVGGALAGTRDQWAVFYAHLPPTSREA